MSAHWVYDDGGRRAAGHRGETYDCVCRSIATATGLPYDVIYAGLNEEAMRERPGCSKRRGGRRSNARTGVFRATIHRFLTKLGWSWVPTMKIGTGCRVHLLKEELPAGRLVVSCSKHITAMIDGVIHDTYDPSRDETRCVYGYWVKP